MTLFSLVFALLASAEFIDEPVALDISPESAQIDATTSDADEVIGGQTFGLLRNLFMPYMGMGGGYGNNMMLNAGGYGSNMGSFNRGNSYSNRSGWDRGYNYTDMNNYSLGGYNNMGGNFLSNAMGSNGYFYRRLSESEAVEDPDSFSELPPEFTNAMSYSGDAKPAETDEDGADDASDDEVIGGQTYRRRFYGPVYTAPAYVRPVYGGYPMYSQPYYRPYPAFFRRLAEVDVLPELPTIDDHHDEETSEGEVIDGQSYSGYNAPMMGSPMMGSPMMGYPYGGGYMGGGMNNGMMNSASRNYRNARGGYNQGSTYSNQSGWDRGYNNTVSNNYSQGYNGMNAGNNQYMGRQSNSMFY